MIPSKMKVGTAYIRCCTTKLKRQKNINNEIQHTQTGESTSSTSVLLVGVSSIVV